MAPTKISISRADLCAPVYLAGTFTDWKPSIELEFEPITNEPGFEKTFYKLVELPPGIHQYKFRLGDGDWWIADEAAEQVIDEAGNVNNVIIIPHLEPKLNHSLEKKASTLRLKAKQDDKPSLRWSTRSISSNTTTSATDVTIVDTNRLLVADRRQGDGAASTYGTISGNDTQTPAVGKTSPPPDEIQPDMATGTHMNTGSGVQTSEKVSIWTRMFCCSNKTLVVGAISALVLALFVSRWRG